MKTDKRVPIKVKGKCFKTVMRLELIDWLIKLACWLGNKFTNELGPKYGLHHIIQNSNRTWVIKSNTSIGPGKGTVLPSMNLLEVYYLPSPQRTIPKLRYDRSCLVRGSVHPQTRNKWYKHAVLYYDNFNSSTISPSFLNKALVSNQFLKLRQKRSVIQKGTTVVQWDQNNIWKKLFM